MKAEFGSEVADEADLTLDWVDVGSAFCIDRVTRRVALLSPSVSML